MSWRDVLKIHPACELFPPMTDDEQRALGDDIKKNRLRERVKLIRDGNEYAVIDGRNRLDAVEAAGLAVTIFDGRGIPSNRFFEVVDLDIDPFDYVMALNARRRHMTSEQKREVAGKLLLRFPDRSNLAIAKMIGISDKTVASVRQEMEGRSEIRTSETRTDTQSRQQPAHRPSTTAGKVRDRLEESGEVERLSTRTDARGHEQPARRPRPSAPPSDAPAPAPPAIRKFTPGETLADIVWTIEALVRSIADTAPAEVVAESDPAALVRLAGDAGLASAWLAALEVLAASAARRCDAGQGAPPIASGEAVGTQATPAASVAPEASHRGGAL